MKKTSDFLQQAGIDLNFYKQITGGIRTRQRPTLDHPPQKKLEEKKKCAKIEQYAPPQIKKLIKPQKISQQQFAQQIKEILKIQEGQQLDFDLATLYQVYSQVNQLGGVVQATSINAFNQIIKKHFPQAEGDMTKIQKLHDILFSLQYTNRNVQEHKKLYNLGIVNFVSKEQLANNIHDIRHGLQYFNYDLTLFQEGAEGLKFDKQIFCLSHMCDHYKHQNIDIRIQNPLDYGFKVTKLKNKKYKMTLGQYRFYQQNYLNPQTMKGFKHLDVLGKGQIFFGVNFEPQDDMLNTQVKRYVHGTFLDFHGDFDMMSYLDQDIPGCSIPQMYFKAPGCWTGGHQENISMSALNINHGPDYSEWYTLDLKYVQSLREELKKKFGIDLYEAEGLWYEGLDWFIRHGYPVKRFLQRKDDIVVTGPGTLHWVRSFGVAIQTSWNIMPKNYEQFEAAFKRHRENKKIKFERSDTIPIKSLILKYLNHQRTTMKAESLKLCTNQLSAWLDEEDNVLSFLQGKIHKRTKFYLKDLQSFCCLCKQEVLVYFLAAPKQKKKGIQCLSCFKQHSKKGTAINNLFYKHQYYDVQTLITVCSNPQMNYSNSQEIQNLCKGLHVGKIGKCSKEGKKDKMGNKQIQDTDLERVARQQIYEQGKREYLQQLYDKIDGIHEQLGQRISVKRKNKTVQQVRQGPVYEQIGIQYDEEKFNQFKAEIIERSREKNQKNKYLEDVKMQTNRSPSPRFSDDSQFSNKSKKYAPFQPNNYRQNEGSKIRNNNQWNQNRQSFQQYGNDRFARNNYHRDNERGRDYDADNRRPAFHNNDRGYQNGRNQEGGYNNRDRGGRGRGARGRGGRRNFDGNNNDGDDDRGFGNNRFGNRNNDGDDERGFRNNRFGNRNNDGDDERGFRNNRFGNRNNDGDDDNRSRFRNNERDNRYGNRNNNDGDRYGNRNNDNHRQGFRNDNENKSGFSRHEKQSEEEVRFGFNRNSGDNNNSQANQPNMQPQMDDMDY